MRWWIVVAVIVLFGGLTLLRAILVRDTERSRVRNEVLSKLEAKEIVGGLGLWAVAAIPPEKRVSSVVTLEVYSNLCETSKLQGRFEPYVEPRRNWRSERQIADPWGNPYNIRVWWSTNSNGRLDLTTKVWSNGANGRNEESRGDDILEQATYSNM